jgi:hypothetical protein
MAIPMRIASAFLAIVLGTLGCGAETAPDTGDFVADATSAATVRFTADFETELVGRPKAGKPLRVDYALERLPQCRGNLGGGGPGWNVTGYFSENGGPAKTFEVSEVTSDGSDRVAKAASIVPSQGGTMAFWFQVSSRWGCSEFDSAFGQNFHVDVEGPPPDASASLVFGEDGRVDSSGVLEAGGKVRITYAQDRLPQCRRTQAGNPLWTITGFASIDGGEPRTFQTGRPEGADRQAIDAVLDLPRSGELALWFQVTSIGGCSEFDSNGGENYRFSIE